MFKGRIAAVLSLILALAFFSTFLRGKFSNTVVSGNVYQRPTIILDAGHPEFT